MGLLAAALFAPVAAAGAAATASYFAPLGLLGSAALQTPRAMAAAAPLPDGDVLIAGGQSANNVLLRSAELFDPTTNTFTKLPASGTPS